MSFIIIKPDAYERGLCGKILTRFEKRGFHPERMWTSVDLTNLHSRVYIHKAKPFYEELCKFMWSGRLSAWSSRSL